MSGKTSETRCKHCGARIRACTTYIPDSTGQCRGYIHIDPLTHVCEGHVAEPTPPEEEAVTEQAKTEVPPVMVGEGDRRDVHPAWSCYRMGQPKSSLLRVGEAENELTRAYDAIVQAQSIPAPVVSTAAPEPPITEMYLCETERLFLKPDQLYKFVVHPTCQRCSELSKIVAPREL